MQGEICDAQLKLQARTLLIMKFTIVEKLCCFLVFTVVNCQNLNLTVKYYENVIMASQTEAFVYPLPENAYEYRSTDKNVAGEINSAEFHLHCEEMQ